MDIKETYLSLQPQYQLASEKMKNLICSILQSNNIETHNITSRVKSISSYTEKAKKYQNPLNEIQDYIGIRIITYVEDDTVKIEKLINCEFVIDKKNSINKSDKLGVDKVGYKSIHLIIKLTESRSTLVEYGFMKDLVFELQIRTILQHTWAEIEHDRNYKFSKVLPQEIKRRFNILAGVLELVDKEFNDIVREIDVYQKDVISDIQKNEYNIELTSTSVFEYCSEKFKGYLADKQINAYWNNTNKDVIDELISFGFTKIKDLDVVIDQRIFQYLKEVNDKNMTLIGLLRDIMMIVDTVRYFEVAYKNHWTTLDFDSFSVITQYAPKIPEYFHVISKDLEDLTTAST